MGTRILHVVWEINRGEIATWLMHILRHIDRECFQMDFLVHTTQPSIYDQEILAFGSQIIPCLYPSRLWIYASNFQRILSKYGPYDVVHSHVNYFSGYILRLAQQRGISTCIAHSHIDTSLMENQVEFSRQMYFSLMKGWIKRYATHGLGCSPNALMNLFGEDWETDSRWQILYCEPFADEIDQISIPMEKSLQHLQCIYQSEFRSQESGVRIEF